MSELEKKQEEQVNQEEQEQEQNTQESNLDSKAGEEEVGDMDSKEGDEKEEEENVSEKALEILAQLAQEDNEEDTGSKDEQGETNTDEYQQRFQSWAKQLGEKLLENPEQAIMELVQVLNNASARQVQMYYDYVISKEGEITERLEKRVEELCDSLGIDKPPASVIQREARAVLQGKRNESDALLKILSSVKKKRRSSKKKSTPPTGVGSGKSGGSGSGKKNDGNVVKLGNSRIFIPPIPE